jgi:hypothetical protein
MRSAVAAGHVRSSAGLGAISRQEVLAMRRSLLVPDVDLLALDEELDLEPVNHLVAQREQQPCDVVVLSLAATRQAKLLPRELALGAATGHCRSAGKIPGAPQQGTTSVLPQSTA